MDYMDSVKIDLCEHWKFHLGKRKRPGIKVLMTAAGKRLRCPMTGRWGCLFQKSNSSGTGYLAGGTGWYRVRFSLPEEYRGKRYGCCSTGFIKTVRYGATAITWENVQWLCPFCL